jgi:hypothetical protein
MYEEEQYHSSPDRNSFFNRTKRQPGDNLFGGQSKTQAERTDTGIKIENKTNAIREDTDRYPEDESAEKPGKPEESGIFFFYSLVE